MPPKHTALFYISFTYYLLRNREGIDTDCEVGDEKQAYWAVLRVCKSSTSRAYSVYCRIKWSISNTLWPWSDSLCFLHLAAKAYNNTSIVVRQGQKACSNLAAVVCGPSSCCIVSNSTYHCHHLTVPTSEKEIPSPSKNNRSAGITWIMLIDKVWRRHTGARASLTAPEAMAIISAQCGTLRFQNAWEHGLCL